MTLVNLTPTDTGNYRCEGPVRLLGRDRFVYVASGLFLYYGLALIKSLLHYTTRCYNLFVRIQVPDI
jgi:hypothetical protein